MAKPPNQIPVDLKLVDHPEVPETFVDSMERMVFDGGTLRMEFVVNRLDDPTPPAPPTGSKHTVCRLVMPASALPHFANQITGLMNGLLAQGVMQRGGTNTQGGGKPN